MAGASLWPSACWGKPTRAVVPRAGLERGWQCLVGIAGLLPLCLHQTQLVLSLQTRKVGKALSVCHPALLGQFLLAGSLIPTREIIFSASVRKSRQKLCKALEEVAAVGLHALSIRTATHRAPVQMGGSALSLGLLTLLSISSLSQPLPPACPASSSGCSAALSGISVLTCGFRQGSCLLSGQDGHSLGKQLMVDPCSGAGCSLWEPPRG